jgi:branched-chain amino acid aminotransferase
MKSSIDMDTIVWFDNRFVPLREAQVNVLTHALNYGTGVFEGIRGYWNDAERDLFLVRAHEHYARMKTNASIIRIAIPQTAEEMCEITADLCRRNEFRAHVYVRPLAFKSAVRIGINPDDEDAYAIVATQFGDYFKNSSGLHAGVVSWRRIQDNAIPGRAKITGGYINSALAGDDARRCGYDEAIFLTDDGFVAEGASCNVFIVRGGKLVTPPSTDNVLEGITRASVMELAREEMRLEVVERRISRTELYVCEEAFFTGTAVEVAPIVKVDHRPVGAGVVGPLTAELRRLYVEATRGRLPKYRRWLTPVYQPVAAENKPVELAGKR